MFNLKTKIDQLASRQGFMRYFKNTSWLMGERILRMAVGLFVGIWVARYLGPEQFGLLSYTQSFVFLFTAIATLGLDGIVVRELVKHPDKRDELLGTAFGLKLIGAVAILPVLAIAVQFSSNDDYTNLLVFIIASATIFQSFNVIDFYYQATVQLKYIAIVNGVVLVIASIIKICLIFYNAPLIAFAAMVVFDSAILCFGLVYSFIRVTGFNVLKWKFSLREARFLLNESKFLIISGGLLMVYMRIDQVMIRAFLGDYEVGVYSVAVKLSEAFYFIPMIVTASVFPSVLSAKEESKYGYDRRIQQLYVIMGWAGIFVAVVVSLLSNLIVPFVYGEAFREASTVLVIQVWSSVFVFMGFAFGKYLILEGMVKVALLRHLVGLFINIGLNLFLIPIMGLIGAAIATLVAHFVSNYGFDVFDKRLHEQFVFKTKALLIPHRVFS